MDEIRCSTCGSHLASRKRGTIQYRLYDAVVSRHRALDLQLTCTGCQVVTVLVLLRAVPLREQDAFKALAKTTAEAA